MVDEPFMGSRHRLVRAPESGISLMMLKVFFFNGCPDLIFVVVIFEVEVVNAVVVSVAAIQELGTTRSSSSCSLLGAEAGSDRTKVHGMGKDGWCELERG